MKKLIAIGSIACIFSLAGATFNEVYQEGIAKIRKGKKEEALDLFRQASELAKNKTEKTNAILQISLAMPVNEENLQTLLDFKGTAGQLPMQLSALLDLRIGHIQTNLKHYEEAEISLENALKKGKLSERDLNLAYNMLSIAQDHLKKYQGMLQTLSQWEKLDILSPNEYAIVRIRQAFAYGNLNQLENAYKTGEDVLTIPGVSPVYQAFAWQTLAHVALSLEKNPQKAKEYSEKSKAIKNGGWGFNRSLHARILKACGEK